MIKSIKLFSILFIASLVTISSNLPKTSAAEQLSYPYKVRDVSGPKSGGIGTWVANAPNGYYIGRAYPGDQVEVTVRVHSCQDNNQAKCEYWVYGYYIQKNFWTNGRKHAMPKPKYGFGWLKENDLYKTGGKGKYRASDINKNKDNLYVRGTIGGDFNCGPHKCRGGTSNSWINKKPGTCSLSAYNDAVISKNRKYVVPYNKAGNMKRGDKIDYRFRVAYPNKSGTYLAVVRHTSKDAKRASLGWVMIDDRCVDGDRKGGPGLN